MWLFVPNFINSPTFTCLTIATWPMPNVMFFATWSTWAWERPHAYAHASSLPCNETAKCHAFLCVVHWTAYADSHASEYWHACADACTCTWIQAEGFANSQDGQRKHAEKQSTTTRIQPNKWWDTRPGHQNMRPPIALEDQASPKTRSPKTLWNSEVSPEKSAPKKCWKNDEFPQKTRPEKTLKKPGLAHKTLSEKTLKKRGRAQ